jgi:ABC-2 type transport system permease protein
MPHAGDTNGSGLLAPERLFTVLSSANLWVGVVAGLALLAGAVWLRGRRIEVNV